MRSRGEGTIRVPCRTDLGSQRMGVCAHKIRMGCKHAPGTAWQWGRINMPGLAASFAVPIEP